MRRLLLILLLASPCWATWTLTQVKDNASCTSGTTCAVTVTSTGSGHLLVAAMSNTNNITISGVSSAACSSTWTHAANTNVFDAGAPGATDMYYCLNSASGQTSITITLSGTIANGLGVIWEASSSAGNIALDSGTTPSQHNDDASCTSCAGVSLVLSANNDFAAAIAGCASACTGLTGTGWVNDLSNPDTDGVAHHLSATGSITSPATWTASPAGIVMASAVAFQETSSTVGPNVGFKGKVGLVGKIGIK